MTPLTEPLYPAATVGSLLRAAEAYRAALAASARLPSYLAAVAAAFRADETALLLIHPLESSPVVLARHNVQDDERLRRLGRPPYLPGVGTISVVMMAERGGPALVADADGVRLCLLYPIGAAVPAVADVVALTLLCRTCDPANLNVAGLAAPDDAGSLPGRLGQTLRGLLAGHSEREIGTAMGISHHTVHAHVKVLYRRFGVTSRAGLLSRFITDRKVSMGTTSSVAAGRIPHPRPD